MQPLTKEQAITLTAVTGNLCCQSFSDFHEDVEKRLGHPVWTHQFADADFTQKIRDEYFNDFLAMVEQGYLED